MRPCGPTLGRRRHSFPPPRPHSAVRAVHYIVQYILHSITSLPGRVPLSELCANMPGMLEYLQYVRALTFDADPDYEYLRRLFLQQGHSSPADWATQPGRNAPRLPLASQPPTRPPTAPEAQLPARGYHLPARGYHRSRPSGIFSGPERRALAAWLQQSPAAAALWH